jgi:hypothetical protein
LTVTVLPSAAVVHDSARLGDLQVLVELRQRVVHRLEHVDGLELRRLPGVQRVQVGGDADDERRVGVGPAVAVPGAEEPVLPALPVPVVVAWADRASPKPTTPASARMRIWDMSASIVGPD